MPLQFDTDLTKLKEDLLRMGALAERMIHDVTVTAVDGNAELLKQVYEREEEMDRLQTEIDEETIRMIGVYTPVAGDLRLLMMITRINAELERIGDRVVNVGHIVESLMDKPPKTLVDLPRIAQASESMVRGALNAFVNGSESEAMAVIAADDEIDKLSDQMFRVILTHMLDDPHTMGRMLGLMLMAQAFERLADHAVNIAEDVVYMVKGKDIRHLDKQEDGGA
jgi:phosphate transport system protein